MAVRGRTAIYPVRIDQTTDAAAVVDYEHKEVHTGDAFYVTQVGEIDNAGVTSHRFYPPNTIEPTLVESQAMVEHFRAGKLPWDVMKLVRRGNLTFSFEQINDALIAWRGVLTSKSPKSVIIEQ